MPGYLPAAFGAATKLRMELPSTGMFTYSVVIIINKPPKQADTTQSATKEQVNCISLNPGIERRERYSHWRWNVNSCPSLCLLLSVAGESARASLTRSYTQVLASGNVEQEMSSFTCRE